MLSRRTPAALAACIGAFAITGASAANGAHVIAGRSFFEKNSSFIYTTADGATHDGAPSSKPQRGSHIEFTDLNYSGTGTHHSQAWSSTDHFICTFTAKGPVCDGEVTIGSSMVIVKGSGGDGTFSIPIVAGTGSFLGDHGTLRVDDIGNSLNANIEIDLDT